MARNDQLQHVPVALRDRLAIGRRLLARRLVPSPVRLHPRAHHRLRERHLSADRTPGHQARGRAPARRLAPPGSAGRCDHRPAVTLNPVSHHRMPDNETMPATSAPGAPTNTRIETLLVAAFIVVA